MEQRPGADVDTAQLTAQEHLSALLEAVAGLGEDLDLPTVLERIVEAACRLSGARYGALGVLDDTTPGRLSAFVTHGLTPQERAAIGPLPRGHGLLGRLITDPRPLRLEDLRTERDSSGFPPGHPPMRTFLGVPVRIRGTAFGNLYLTEKEGGRPFTAEDEQVVTALASAAGLVVHSAHLHAVSESRAAVLDATTQIHTTLLGEVDLETTLPLVTQRVLELVDGTASAVIQDGEGGSPVVLASTGRDSARVLTACDAAVRQVLADGQAQVLSEVASDAAAPREDAGPSGPQHDFDGVHVSHYHRTTLMPLQLRNGRRALLLVAGWHQRTGLSDEELMGLLGSFAAQVTLALDRAQAQDDREALAVLADRDRIARDLHDLVIQRLFATGLQLQGAIRLAVRPEVTERIQATVTDLDATIRDIRATIFELHHRPGAGSLRSDLRELVASYTPTLGFAPLVQFHGPVDTAVSDDGQIQLLAVLREGLSNVARHARASSVLVEVTVTGSEVVAQVVDDGVGLAPHTRESGLRNLRQRAAERGGTVRLMDHEPNGTILQWRIPIA